jgi:hypothetical protein
MANIVKSLGCLSAWVILLGLESAEAAESSSGWKAGVARVDTTPTKPVRMEPENFLTFLRVLRL